MKRAFIFSILLLHLVFVYGQKATLKEHVKQEGVTSVTLSKKMLSFLPQNADISYGGINVADFLDKLSSINIFASPKVTVANKLVDDASQFMEISGYDKLMSVKTDRNDDLNFYIHGNKEYISELILIVQGETKESAVMQFLGKFTMEDIQQMIENASK